MNIAFFIAHPSQYYLFKQAAQNVLKKHNVLLIYYEKDVIPQLVNSCDYGMQTFQINASKKNSKFGFIRGFINKEFQLYKILRKNKIDLIVGTSITIAHVAKIVGSKSMIFTEDDVSVIASSAKLGYPFVNHIVSPNVCNLGKWETKAIKYNGYQKLAYLHPDIFKADVKVVSKYINTESDYFLIRLSGLSAHHDLGISGISKETLSELIRKLEPRGTIFISSENKLDDKFLKYQLKINPIDIHHILAFARMLISDSQSMSVEAAMLGVPSIRVSDFVGKISVLEELEKKYKLTFGVNPSNVKSLLKITDELLSSSKELYNTRRLSMLGEKINVSDFITSLILDYPHSLPKQSSGKIIK